MISSDLASDVVRRAVTRGARDYLAKPVRMHSLEHLWRHLLGKEKWRSYIAKITGDTSELGKHGRVKEEEVIGTTSRLPKGVIKVKEEVVDDDVVDGYGTHASGVPVGAGGTVRVKEEVDSEEEEERRRRGSTVPSSRKPRMSWTPELHQKFVTAVNQLGTNASPKKIVEVMGVPDLTARHVASHLQKYRRNLKRAAPPVAIASTTPSASVAAVSWPGLVQPQPLQSMHIRSPISSTFPAGMYRNQYYPGLLLQQPQPVSLQYNIQTATANVPIGQTPNVAAGYDCAPVIDFDIDGMDSFLMHANASGSFQAGKDLPFVYPAISSQCNTQALTRGVPVIDHRERSIPLIDLDIDDGIDIGGFALPGLDHDSGKRVEGSFYDQDNQMNQGFAGQDHLVLPVQYVNGGVLTDTDTNFGPCAVSGGREATVDTDNNSKALVPLDQSCSQVTNDKEVGSTSQSMATDIYDDSEEFIENLLNLYWYD
ncbi:two-component response regulator ORR21 isoform X1 [Iris pallida]|uniref:Two-component response regulator ORR21 isoform X1 n=1 Tax=Iris pallida TaxID=29817 RepID=A0AAX6FYW9_IRIPA|nr:two-component response regulator ORR21 isoform X1 [Iris pallida]